MSYSSKSYSSGSEPASPETPPLRLSASTSAHSLVGHSRRRGVVRAYRDSYPMSPPLKPRHVPALPLPPPLDRLVPSLLAGVLALFLLACLVPAPLPSPVALDLAAHSALLPPDPAPAHMSNPDVVRAVRRWQDPAFAAANLKVYYYELPDKFHRTLVSDSHRHPPPIRDPHCDESFYSAEVTLANYFRTGPVRTLNASEADYFYVPILTTCYLLTHLPNDVHRTGAFFNEAMDHIIQDYPYWNATDGRDHLFMFAQGFGARLTGDWERYKRATFLVHNGDYAEPHFDPHKDIVVPPDLSHYLTPVGLSSPGALLRKKHFVLFGGQVLNTSISDHRGSNYSGGVRQFIQRSLAPLEGYRVTGVRSPTYVQDMMESVFCLAPHGWHKWSPRPAYAVLLGCIPVVISEQQELFLGHMLDYRELSYWVRPGEVGGMDGKLRGLGHRELARREMALREVWPLFWYGRDGLAEEAVLYSLQRRLATARPERPYI